ncbi:hypothetical protein Patl_0038 [Paraglaciecola sp. T6c]|nr:hypothetical protein Patl_0038 [Paraglaciecola sp. T6c]
MRFLFLSVFFLIVGCNSTPNRDDYAKHINTMGKAFHGENTLAFSFAQNEGIDLRGIHNRDDSTSSSPILYQGGAGLVGMFAQIGAHAAFINSSRNAKLAEEQERADNKISPLINLINGVSIFSLLDRTDSLFVKNNDIDNETLRLKPIFFSNEKMNQVILKLIAWLPDEKGRTKNLRYQNMIQVFSPILSEDEHALFVDENNDDVKQMMARQLNTAIHILQSDLTGRYTGLNEPQNTFTILRNDSSKVVRGSVVDNKCGFQVVQDLHSWYIAFPTKTPVQQDTPSSPEQC